VIAQPFDAGDADFWKEPAPRKRYSLRRALRSLTERKEDCAKKSGDAMHGVLSTFLDGLDQSYVGLLVLIQAGENAILIVI